MSWNLRNEERTPRGEGREWMAGPWRGQRIVGVGVAQDGLWLGSRHICDEWAAATTLQDLIPSSHRFPELRPPCGDAGEVVAEVEGRAVGNDKGRGRQGSGAPGGEELRGVSGRLRAPFPLGASCSCCKITTNSHSLPRGCEGCTAQVLTGQSQAWAGPCSSRGPGGTPCPARRLVV